MKHCIFLIVSYFLSCLTAEAQTGQFISADRFSSSLINDLCQDRQGSMWVATDYGLNRYDGYSFETFLHQSDDSKSLCDNMTVCLLSDAKGNLWVGTRLGLDRFDTSTETFHHYPFPDGYTPRVSTLYQMHDGRLFVGTAGYGAYVIGEDTGWQLQQFSKEKSGFYSRIFEDSKGRLWHSGFDQTIVMEQGGQATTFHSEYGNPQAFVEQDGEILIVCLHGIMAYKNDRLQTANIDMSIINGRDVIFSRAFVSTTGTLYLGTRGSGLFSVAPGEHRRLSDMAISTLGVDMQTAKVSAAIFDARGNIWLGCHSKGLVMVPLRPEQFQNWSFETQGIRLGSTISSVCEGDDGMTWVTVQGVGIYGFNSKGRVVAHPSSPDAVEFIFRDKLLNYWVGTDDGLYEYDPLTGHSKLRVKFECDRFNDMTSDAEGNIYISTFSRGFSIYNTKTGDLRHFSMNDANDSIRGRLCNDWILAMMPDRHGRLWMATSSGVSCYDPHEDTFRPFGWEQLLPGVMCYSVCETSRGQVFIGTDQGLFLYKPGKSEPELFSEADILRNKVVYYIVEANDGDLWCSTTMGIWQYTAQSHEFIGHVAGNGLMKKEYIMNVGLHTDDDRILFGHNDGLTVFSPLQMKTAYPTLPDSLHLTAFRAGDQYVNASTELNGVRVTDGKSVSDCIYFTLSYLDHTVALAFSLYNFETAMNVCLEYRVNSDEWIRQQEGKNEISLAHLQPGTYRVEVRACQGGECSPSKVVVITVRSPWYRTPMAYFIYLLLLVALLALLGMMWRRKANQQLDEEKMKFLINATHDIRSPLTIILSAIKKLKTVSSISPVGEAFSAGLSARHEGALETIERNSQRILNLVNQILDVRKIDKQQMHLHCRNTEMVQFVAGICKMFEFNAQERGIALSFLHEGIDSLPAWVDRSQFDKVVTNLLSNAFKFTKDGGEITVSLKGGNTDQPGTAPTVFTLQVTDTGMGLDTDTLRHIFDRFYQGSNSRSLNIDGTGIGLNLCKMIVDMHHGTIAAENRTDGRKGSVFTVSLPLGCEHLKPEEMDTTEEIKPVATLPATASPQSPSTTRKRVLLVDDDAEIGEYIKQELGRFYKFGLCPNGKEGLKELLTNDYDLVVSDVMMPEMDGFTMLRMIKSNLNLSHLPVIMLTSKADVANRLEGLEHGADAFLAKPFDMEELHLTIENLIQGRRHLKG